MLWLGLVCHHGNIMNVWETVLSDQVDGHTIGGTSFCVLGVRVCNSLSNEVGFRVLYASCTPTPTLEWKQLSCSKVLSDSIVCIFDVVACNTALHFCGIRKD